jgi:hypothetical protein
MNPARNPASLPSRSAANHKRVVSRGELANPEHHGATASTDTGGWQSRWLIIASTGVEPGRH